MSFGSLLGILIRVHILYYKSVKEPNGSFKIDSLTLFAFFNIVKKNMCAPIENKNLGLT